MDQEEFAPQLPEDEDSTIVPAEDTEVADAPAAEENLDKSPDVKKMKRFAIFSGCLAVLAVLALVLFIGVQGGVKLDVKSWFDWEVFRGNDVFKKDSYTLSDSKAQDKADVVVATMGDAKLTNGELQIYYQMQFLDFMNQYGTYASYFGLDYTKPLDEQECKLKEGYTWQQYFLESALGVWRGNQAMALMAKEKGFELSSEYQQKLDSLENDMTANAVKYGMTTADELVKAQCGGNTSMAAYRSYMETYYIGSIYFYDCFEKLEQPDDAALDAYYQAHKEEMESSGIKQDGSYCVDVRHILIAASGTENADGTITFTDAEKAAEAKAKAEEILAAWLEDPTEAHFAALAKEHTADGNGDAGGLYEGVTPGQMVASFNDWCFDESRKAGDYGIVETRFGYHIMFFSARGEEIWLAESRDAYLQDEAMKVVEQAQAAYPMEVSYSKIALAHVDMN